MHEEKSSPVKEEPVRGEESEIEKSATVDATPKSSGGWGWGFSVLSDLQKAAEEISRNVCSHSNFDLIL